MIVCCYELRRSIQEPAYLWRKKFTEKWCRENYTNDNKTRIGFSRGTLVTQRGSNSSNIFWTTPKFSFDCRRKHVANLFSDSSETLCKRFSGFRIKDVSSYIQIWRRDSGQWTTNVYDYNDNIINGSCVCIDETGKIN